MRVEPYLMFAGRCAEALSFYQQAVGAQPTMVLRFRESPEPPAMPLPPGWDDKIMHCGFMVGGTLVMASDGMATDAPAQGGITLSLTADSEADARRMFGALAEGGSIFMPMGATFWSPCFGMCTDRFGVPWMVGVDGPQG